MRYNIVGYLISEGFKSVFKQKKMSSASIIIMCATMLIFGLFFLIGENVNYAMKQVESQQGMKVNIKNDATQTQIDDLKVQIQKIDGVNKVTFQSKEDALATVKKWLGNKQDIIAGYDENNPFPASYFVTLTDLSKNKEVQEQILKLDGVSDISSENDTIANLAKVADIVQRITLVILILLIVISVFIIAYTIKLTVYARRREITIMKYVGATNGFIRGPFIVEGMIIGVISAIITALMVGFMYNAAIKKVLSSSVIKMTGLSLYSYSELSLKLFGVYLLLGIGIGILGSMISMRRYLKV